MTKRAFQKFEREDGDFYPTPRAAVLPIVPYLRKDGITTFAEPCYGDGSLADALEGEGFVCTAHSDIRHGKDARSWTAANMTGVDAVVTNPPWAHEAMTEIMTRLSELRPCWFLIYWDWLSNMRAADIINHLVTDVVPIGRVKWIPDSTTVGFDNACWVRLAADKEPLTPAHLWPRR